MKISVSQEQSEEMKEFAAREWAVWDQEHYGKVVDWSTSHFYLIAKEEDKIVGIAVCEILLNVLELKQLLTHQDHHRKGIGKSLIGAVENLCKEKGAHKIYLTTGKGWKAEHFYTALGFERTAELKNHYLNKDFVLYTKFVK